MKDPNQIEYQKPNGRIGVKTVNAEPSMTQQQFKDDCDVNNILAKYINTGEFLSQTSKQGRYADFSQIVDYQGMLDQVIAADQAFMSLPAKVRSRFRNDPGELISFLQDEKNYDEALQLGLVNPKPAAPQNDEPNDEIAAAKPKKQKAQVADV